MTLNTRPVALFDFDGTLTTRDSLVPFLETVAGPLPVAIALLMSAPAFLRSRAGRITGTAAKQRLLARVLGGLLDRDLRLTGNRFAWRGLQRLLSRRGAKLIEEHRRARHDCVLASASLDLYLQPWAAGAGFVHCIASSLLVDAEGRVSGELRDGNCQGEEKLRRVRDWLADREPDRIFAYSNSTADAPMLRFADDAFMVRGQQVRRWAG